MLDEGNTKTSAGHLLPTTTAALRPDQFTDGLFIAKTRKAAAITLVIFLLIGFALRVSQLGAESFSEDELNKFQTVEEYRSNGLSGKNGEHPFLMKGLQTISVIAAENANSLFAPSPAFISDEGALRFPLALFGTLTGLLIFLLISELFGRSIGLVSAALWAVEPMAIGFDRIAKEDSLVLFFFLLTNLFWIRGQTAAERGRPSWTWYAWAAAASFAALMASKYYPHLLAVPAAYYIIFQYLPTTKWRMETVRWLKFIGVMAVVFIILNPTILLPETWREMLKFSTENRIGHDSYEYIGGLYPNKMSAWLAGVPWTFYYVFIAVKTSVSTLILFLLGLPLMFRRKLGDGRFFIFFWAFFWFMPFTFLGGKFTRYFTLVEPLILIAASVGFCVCLNWLANKLSERRLVSYVIQATLLLAFLAVPLWNSVHASPHFRLFTNSVGGGMSAAGSYFPHDEFYDGATRDIVANIAMRAAPLATIACESPSLYDFYSKKNGRPDLVFVSLSDKSKVAGLKSGDFVVLAKGRRYFSNAAYFEIFKDPMFRTEQIRMGHTVAATILQLDEETAAALRSVSN
ncbi:hypothetical protein BH10ACI3_BH10ACI3_10510 [soil metagenome]